MQSSCSPLLSTADGSSGSGPAAPPRSPWLRSAPGPPPPRPGSGAERPAHPGASRRHHHLHPARRPEPARASRRLADDGLPRWGRLPRRPHRPRAARPAAGRLEGAVRVLRRGRHQPGRVRRLRAERRQPGRHGGVPARRQRGRPGGVPRLCPHAARPPRRQRARGDRQPRQHPEHLVRPEQPRRHDDRRRLHPAADRARVRLDPRHAVHGHRQRPPQRVRPQHRALDDRGGEVGGAQPDRTPVGHPDVHAQPRRGLPLPAGRPPGHGDPGPRHRGADRARPRCGRSPASG